MSAPVEPDYFAFISYSHQDQLWADWLHKALETYRVPRRLVGATTAAGPIPARLVPVFRDREDLASANDLGRKVNAALARSKNLIVICSPHAAASRWVNEEVLAFKRQGGGERIFCLIVGGEPNASALPGREGEECFAPALRHVVDASGAPTGARAEPIAADARAGKDGKTNAKLKLVAGMLDVGFDVLKQRELHRRNRRLAVLAAAALVVMAITTTLAITAVIARHDAERRQKQAEDLVSFMLGDLSEKLNEVQRLDIMAAVNDQAMKYFESQPTGDVTDESLAQRAKAFERIGSVRLNQGDLPAAMESFDAAVKVAALRAEAAPADAARQVAYSRVLAFRGMTYWNRGNLDFALADFKAAEAAIGRADPRAADDPDLLFQLTSVDNNIGHVLEARGELDAAERQYRKMLEHCQRLVAGPRTNVQWQAQLGAAHNNLGKLALMRGDLAQAVAEYRADDAIESRLSAEDPKNNEQRTNMFTVRAILGRTLALTGAIDEGMADLEHAVDIATQVSAVDPSNTDVLENLALYKMQLSRLLRLAGHVDKAGQFTREALDAFVALTTRQEANAAWQRELAETRVEYARQLLATRQADAAREQARLALDSLEKLLAQAPDNRSILLAAGAARLLSARLADPADAVAVEQRQRVLAMVASVKTGKRDPRLVALEVEALLALGRSAEAEPPIRQLWEGGYRDPGLIEVLQAARVPLPPSSPPHQLQAIRADNAQLSQQSAGKNALPAVPRAKQEE